MKCYKKKLFIVDEFNVESTLKCLERIKALTAKWDLNFLTIGCQHIYICFTLHSILLYFWKALL